MFLERADNAAVALLRTYYGSHVGGPSRSAYTGALLHMAGLGEATRAGMVVVDLAGGAQ